jgi:hypothetical protein
LPRSLALVAFLAASLALAPAAADDWSQYTNARFGFVVDVPPGFADRGTSDNGDGAVFSTPNATLTVFGQNLVRDFEDEVRGRRGVAGAEGWSVSYQVSTPQRASYSGKRGARILYVRMIALCGGAAFGAFEIEYSVADMVEFDPVVTRMVRSMRATGEGC